MKLFRIKGQSKLVLTTTLCLLISSIYGLEETITPRDVLPEIQKKYDDNPVVQAILNHNQEELEQALNDTPLDTSLRISYQINLPGNGRYKVDYDLLALAIYNSRIAANEIERINDIGIVKTLLDNGVAVNIPSEKNEVKLVGKTFIGASAQTGIDDYEAEIQYRAWKGTPLAAAVDVARESNAALDIIELLLSYGADVNASFYSHLDPDEKVIRSLPRYAEQFSPSVFPLLERESKEERSVYADSSDSYEGDVLMQKERALHEERARNENLVEQVEHFKVQVGSLSEAKASEEARRKQVEDECLKLEVQCNNREKEVERLSKELGDAKNDLADVHAKEGQSARENAELTARIKRFEIQIEGLNEAKASEETKRTQAEGELQKLEVQFKDCEKELESLSKEVKELEETKRQFINTGQKENVAREKVIDEERARNKKLATQIESFEAQVKGLNEAKASEEARRAQVEGERQKLAVQFKDCEKKLESLSKELDNAKNELADVHTKEGQSAKENAELTAQVKRFETQMKGLNEAKANEEARRKQAEDERQKLEVQFSTQRTEVARLSKELDNAKNELAGVHTKEGQSAKENAELTAQVKRFETQMKGLNEAKASEEARRAMAEDELQKLDAQYNTQRTEVARLSKELEEVQMQLSNANEKEKQLSGEKATLAEQVRGLEARVEELGTMSNEEKTQCTQVERALEKLQLGYQDCEAEVERLTMTIKDDGKADQIPGEKAESQTKRPISLQEGNDRYQSNELPCNPYFAKCRARLQREGVPF